MTLVNKLS